MEVKVVKSASYEQTIKNDIERLEDYEEFKEGFTRLVAACHETAVMKGWWNPEKSFGEQLLLFVSEISEATEEFRNGHGFTEIYFVKDKDGNDKPEGIPIELADLFIRGLDTCGRYDINILYAMFLKMRYNLSREQRHGGKVI